MEKSVKIFLLNQIITIFVITLDIPIARQILGFIYIIILPGFLILKLLKIKINILKLDMKSLQKNRFQL